MTNSPPPEELELLLKHLCKRALETGGPVLEEAFQQFFNKHRYELWEYIRIGIEQLAENGHYESAFGRGTPQIVSTAPSGEVPEYAQAREIFGKDFVSPEEIRGACGKILYREQYLARLRQTIPSRKTLEWGRKRGYRLIAGPHCAMNLDRLHTLPGNRLPPMNREWYENHKFVRRDKVSPGWLMIHPDAVVGSNGWTWEQQLAILEAPQEVVPNIAEVCWGLQAYLWTRGRLLLTEVQARTNSVDDDGSHVGVALSTEGGVLIPAWRDDAEGYDLGIATMRRKLFPVRS